MEIALKPISESSAKIFAIVTTDNRFVDCTEIICISKRHKELLSSLVGISLKSVENCITELVVTKYLMRIKQQFYKADYGFLQENGNTVVVCSNFVFTKI